jgi:iron complex transport system ATP-binding protein
MPAVVELKKVTLVKGGNVILDGVDMILESGNCCAVIGPNGSGKSTLIAVITGYQWPGSGSVSFCGEEYGRVSLAEVRRNISLITTSRVPRFDHNMSAFDVAATGLFETIRLPINTELTDSQKEHVRQVINDAGIEKLSGRAFYSLSTGERMNFLICRALVKKPKLLVLDEPTAGLDIRNRQLVLESLSALQQTGEPPAILIVSHHLAELPSRVDCVCMLKNGTFTGQGRPEEMFTSDKLTELFDWPIEVKNIAGRYYTNAKI